MLIRRGFDPLESFDCHIVFWLQSAESKALNMFGLGNHLQRPQTPLPVPSELPPVRQALPPSAKSGAAYLRPIASDRPATGSPPRGAGATCPARRNSRFRAPCSPSISDSAARTSSRDPRGFLPDGRRSPAEHALLTLDGRAAASATSPRRLRQCAVPLTDPETRRWQGDHARRDRNRPAEHRGA